MVQFFNDLTVVFFYLAASLNFYKWLCIINRAYLFSGRFTDWRFKLQNKVNMVLYIFFVATGSSLNIAFMCLDLISNFKDAASS